jgi:hypothetical protein
MEGNWLSLVGIGFFAFALWRAVQVRRDLASGETRWERALFGGREPIYRASTPVKYWCAIILHIAIVFLLALVGAVAMRAVSLALRRM